MEIKDLKRVEIKKEIGDLRHDFDGLNTSSLWTILIKEAGKCERYASDILYDWEEYQKNIMEMKNKKINNFTQYFGFRDMGVDGNLFVKCRLDDANDLHQVYRKLYCMKVVSEENFGYSICTARLYELEMEEGENV